MFQTSIVGFTIVNAAQQDSTCGGAPGWHFLRNDTLTGAILVIDFKLSQQGKLFSVHIALPSPKADPAAEPAVPQNGADRIITFSQHSCHVEGLVAQMLVIGGPARGEDLITDDFPVYLGFI